MLREAIADVDDAIAARRKLSRKIGDQVDRELREVLDHLNTLPPPWSGGYLVEREGLRMALHRNATSRRRERRQEELKFWDDLVRLLEKRRDLERQLQQLNLE